MPVLVVNDDPPNDDSPMVIPVVLVYFPEMNGWLGRDILGFETCRC